MPVSQAVSTGPTQGAQTSAASRGRTPPSPKSVPQTLFQPAPPFPPAALPPAAAPPPDPTAPPPQPVNQQATPLPRTLPIAPTQADARRQSSADASEHHS